MKATVAIVSGWVAIVLSFSAGSAVAGPIVGGAAILVGAASLGQTAANGSLPEDKRPMVAGLLQRARQAMAENDLATADALIAQAESLKVEYSPITMEDTPKKARSALERLRTAGAASATRPSPMFSPLSLGKPKEMPTDPFLARSAGRMDEALPDGSLPGSQQVMPLPPTDAAHTIHSATAADFSSPQPSFGQTQTLAPPAQDDLHMPPALARQYNQPAVVPAAYTSTDVAPGDNRGNAMQAPTNTTLFNGQQAFVSDAAPTSSNNGAAPNDRVQSYNLLRLSRRALGVGDVRRAADMLNQAKRLAVHYGPLDDSPEKVETAISKYQEVAALDRNTDAYRRSYARMAMEQSEALLRYGELQQAEELADRAARQQATFGPFEAKPQDLLNRINAARRQDQAAIRPLPTPAPADAAATVRLRESELVRQARLALSAGQLDGAEFLAKQAEQLRMQSGLLGPGEDQAGRILAEIRRARATSGGGASSGYAVVQAGGMMPSGTPADRMASRAVYDPGQDATRNIQVANQQPMPPVPTQRPDDLPEPVATPAGQAAAAPSAMPAPGGQPVLSPGYELFRQGEAALKAHDRDHAYQLFRQAMAYSNQMDAETARRLQDHLQLLSNPEAHSAPGTAGRPPLDEAEAKQKALARQLADELQRQQTIAHNLLEKDPKAGLAMLEQERKKIEAAGLDPQYRDLLLRNIDRSLRDTQQYIEHNRASIELGAKNDRTRDEIAREQQFKLDRQEKVAAKVDEYNHLMDEQRYAEAEIVAKQAAELDPKNPVVEQLLLRSRFVRMYQDSMAIKDEKERLFGIEMNNVDRASIPFDDLHPMEFPDVKDWKTITKSRNKLAQDRQRRRTEQEMEIEKKLKTPVSVTFKAMPLSKVMDQLARLADVNLHLDPQGLSEEGISSDTPITIEIAHQVMLKSALNLILEPLHLSYVVKDEVLKITSEQKRAGQVYTVTYNVADLVMPIPKFTGGANMGLQGAYRDAMANVSGGAAAGGGTMTTPLAVMAGGKQSGSGAVNSQVLAQMAGTVGGAGQQNNGMGFGGPGGASGPGGLGGGAQADFDSLIELITSTVQPTTWDAVGGPGSIARFETNLSLVVSQTQEVHEEIVDLLEQLRRMQDLQVTIEVRFITLNDNFFERIGVDFDFNIMQNTQNPTAAGFGPVTTTSVGGNAYTTRIYGSTGAGTSVAGLQAVGSSPASSGVYTSDLDIPVTQGSYALATPQFGGFDATAGASLGFAILSDVEAFFFINAAQGDKRSNVLQAPKVTLFNGQQAFVSDTSQTPFVISVVPVVGDFAAAQQPVIVVLSEGTFMTVQAVVSNDRRFVRLTIVPFFSQITKVSEFTFQGSTSTTTDSTRNGLLQNANLPANTFNNNIDHQTTTTSGTTVQLPTFSFVTVTTTVSVPDGGTVLLGGIKRLSEGRSEYGVPILDKIPYINRLFKNTGIGRDTSSLMMMVTPRIIIQEEEEEKLGVQTP